MADLENSKRVTERATFTPIKATPQVDSPIGRAVEKWSYFAALRPTVAEVKEVKRRQSGSDNATSKAVTRAWRTLQSAAEDLGGMPGGSLPLGMLPGFAPIPPAVLTAFGEELLRIRREQVTTAVAGHARLLAAYESATSRTTASPARAKPSISAEYKPSQDLVPPGMEGVKAFHLERKATAIEAVRGAKRPGSTAPAPDTEGLTASASTVLLHPPLDADLPSSPSTTPLTVGTLLDWATQQRSDQAAAKATEALLASHNIGRDLTPAGFKAVVDATLATTADLNFAFGQRLQTEPVGMLHLERLAFIPAGIERGELLYSVPLSPAEQVNISHKEWSNTSQEFEQIVTDSLEDYSEEGVTEKSDLAQSTSSQRDHASGYELGVTASGGWGPVSISASASYNVSDSAASSQTTARNQSNELTRKASSRVKREHKTSFKVASAAGTEDQAVRLITNPFPDRATRVDYYQLVRKWRVDLYRYGLRMTYDLTIPEPGSDILAKIAQINSLVSALSEGFGGTSSTLPWARFDLAPGQITRGNYLGLAAQYGVPVEPPPPDEAVIARTYTRNWPNKDAANDSDYTTFELDVPDGYQVRGWSNQWNWWAWTDESYHFEIHPDLNTWLGVAGHLTLSVGTKYVSAFSVQLKLWFGLSADAYNAWKQRAWATLHEAALARYQLQRTMLQDQLARLQEEVGGQDPLSLRKIEREEVMKQVLRWLFGPSFEFVPPGLPADLYGPSGSVVDDQVWAQALAQGDVATFLHQAIEWENMLFLLYPYFWSHTSRWEFKKYLSHPDFLHRTFLKAGSARVVLTIRPGFERDFVSFLETGTLDGLAETHPYMTIAKEMQAFANTNYPGIRAANPIENARPLLSPLQQKAWDQMQSVIALLDQYKASNGSYPSTAQGLAALAPFGTVPPVDPWGTAYHYRSPGAYTDYELASFGSDGVAGGDDEDADIESWVEASLIGRWYEYTPTGAVDIAFDDPIPTS